MSACSSRHSRNAWPRTSRTTCSSMECACATCTPRSTPSSAWRKSVDQVRFTTRVADAKTAKAMGPVLRRPADAREREALIRLLETQMQAAAEELDFELAAVLRDQLLELKAEGDAVHHAPPRGRAQPVR